MPDHETTTGYIRDARGRRVKLLDPAMLHILHRYNVVEESVLHEIVEDLQPGSARWTRHTIAIGAACLVATAGLIATVYATSDAGGRRDLINVHMLVLAVGGLVGGVIAPWIAARQARLRRAGGVMLKHRRCPHCGYDIRSLLVDPSDHATVCPECGCAWQLGADSLSDGPTGHEAEEPGAAPKLVLLSLGALLVLGLVLGVVFFLRRL